LLAKDLPGRGAFFLRIIAELAKIVGDHARVRPCTAAKKEGGSLVRGTQESDRSAPLAPAEIEVV
jgi:hypothetical protein